MSSELKRALTEIIDRNSSTSESTTSSGQWAIWRIVKRIASVILMAIAGAIAFGVVGATLTVFVNYMIGIYVGVPLGLAWGGYRGFKSPARHSVLVFTGPVAIVALAHSAMTVSGAVGFIDSLEGYALAAVSVPVILILVRLLPRRWTYWLAIVDAWIVGLWMVHAAYAALFVAS